MSDTELRRQWQISRSEAVALVTKRQRHPKVVAHIGDSLDDLMPQKRELEGAARYALLLLDANPRMTEGEALKLAAGRIRVDKIVLQDAEPSKNKPRRIVEHGELDVSGVRRAFHRLKKE